MKFPQREIDYLTLMEALKDYAYPRDRVTKLLKRGALSRVKKGLYLWNEVDEPYSREILANLIYGPSYVSREYALSLYGLIPEAVPLVTSVTTGRNKHFDTVAGAFSYRSLPVEYYSPGISYMAGASGRGYMVASPAKALFDMLYLNAPDLREGEIPAYFFENLRMEPDDVAGIDFSEILVLIGSCLKPSIHALALYLKEGKHG
ncbi:MAG: hypothetical protein Q8O15_01550 [Rectinemataceae bacterium]|nr:hypothetical protein [Rectinemataceae bacterium]